VGAKVECGVSYGSGFCEKAGGGAVEGVLGGSEEGSEFLEEGGIGGVGGGFAGVDID
jgi:hypothetical protein